MILHVIDTMNESFNHNTESNTLISIMMKKNTFCFFISGIEHYETVPIDFVNWSNRIIGESQSEEGKRYPKETIFRWFCLFKDLPINNTTTNDYAYHRKVWRNAPLHTNSGDITEI